MAKVYNNATDLITFARSSSGTALRRVGYGPELVTNGGFDTDTSGWTASIGTIAHTGSAVELTTDASTVCSLQQSYTFSSNKVYELTFDLTSVSGSVLNIYNYSASETHDLGSPVVGTYTHVFAGGSSSGDSTEDTIDFVTIATTGNASDFGNLTSGRYDPGQGASSSHGGLGL